MICWRYSKLTASIVWLILLVTCGLGYVFFTNSELEQYMIQTFGIISLALFVYNLANARVVIPDTSVD